MLPLSARAWFGRNGERSVWRCEIRTGSRSHQRLCSRLAAPYCRGRQVGQGACYQNMSADPKPGQDEVNGIAGDDKSPAAGKTPVELALEIAHLLLIDVVGYSKLL